MASTYINIPSAVKLTISHIDIGTVDQGSPNTDANAWPVKITDGTNQAAVTAASALKVDGSAVTQPISAASLPLPAGASTSANQLTIITDLGAIESNQTNGTQVTQVSNFPSVQPISGTVTANQGTSPWVVSGTVTTSPNVNIHDAAGNDLTSQINGSQRALDVGIDVSGIQIDPRQIRALTSADVITADQGGIWNINNITGTISLPTGAATSANQSTEITALGTINTTLGSPFQAGGSIGNTTFAATQSGTWNIGTVTTITNPVTVNQGTSPWVVSGTVTTSPNVNIHDAAGNNLTSQVNGAQRALDVGIDVAGVQIDPRQIRALTSSDVITADQGTSPWVISGTVTANAGTGNFTVVQPTGSNLHVQVDNFPATQPVSGTVAVTQATTPWNDNITQFGSNNVVTGTGASGLGIPRVTVSNDSNILATQSGTWNINNISGTVSLPTGASTSALQTTGNTSLSSIVTNTANIPTVGQKTGSGSTPVVIASDQIASSTSTVTSVSGSASSVSLLASNTSRKAAYLFNDSTAIAYVKLGITASTTSYTLQMVPNSFVVLSQWPIYTGEIDAIWASAAGAMRITELT